MSASLPSFLPMAAGDPCNHKAQLQHKATPPPSSLTTPTPHSRASPHPTFRARAMYQCSSYPDPFLHPLFSAFPSQAPLQPSSPPPATHHHDHHHSFSSYLLYPPSPPHGASPPSAGGGGFLGPAASPSLPSSFLQSSGSSADNSVLSSHLLERSHHHCNGGSGGMNGSPHLYDQHDYFDFPSAMQATNSLRPPPGAESCTQEVGGAAGSAAAMAAAMAGGRVGRYTAEERKERIERYRSKRNHRNFQKKITYACRKTLADSRPRVRGRFARNGEAEPEPEVEGEAGEVSSCNNSSSQSGGEYCVGWRPGADDEDEYGCDPDFWANFLDTMSMNNPMIYS